MRSKVHVGPRISWLAVENKLTCEPLTNSSHSFNKKILSTYDEAGIYAIQMDTERSKADTLPALEVLPAAYHMQFDSFLI